MINKKAVTAVLMLSMFFCMKAAFAEPETADTTEATQTESVYDAEANPERYSDAVGVDVYIDYKMVPTDSTAVFELYDTAGQLLGTCEQWIGSDTRLVYLHFPVERYELGKEFELKLVSGLRSFVYYSDTIRPGESAKLQTYIADNGDGTYMQGNNFIISACPEYEKGICVYYNGSLISFYSRPRVMDGVAMAPVDVLGGAMKLKTQYYPEYNSISTKIGSNEVLFNVGESYTTVFGSDTYISHATTRIDDVFFVPIRDMAEAWGCSVDVADFDDHLDIILGESGIIRDYLSSSRVNSEGITSRTPYLVWIDKANYTVNVYLGSQYNWELIYSCPCGIGAWSTPTIEGQFEYQYRDSRWTYPSYYVGPCLVFHGGYAMHSTLLNYDGTEYDGTVRAHISHGCVRMHPQDINWIASYITVGTKIYITG